MIRQILTKTVILKALGAQVKMCYYLRFLAAYTGKDAGSVKLGAFRDTPLPNWNLKYSGLMRLNWFKERFTRFSLQILLIILHDQSISK